MTKLRPTAWTVLGASAVVVIGSLMPWATLGLFSANGTDGDGTITLILGLVAIGGVLLLSRTEWRPMLVRVITAMAILGAFITSAYDTIHVSTEHLNFLGTQISPHVGSGLWLCLIGSLVAGVAFVIDWRTSAVRTS